jgi:hypothetical protein
LRQGPVFAVTLDVGVYNVYVVAHCLLEDAGLREVWPLVYQKKTCGPAG